MNDTVVIFVFCADIAIAIIALVLIVIGLLKRKALVYAVGIVIFIFATLLFGPISLFLAVPLGIIACVLFLFVHKNNNNNQSDKICPQCAKPVTNDKKFCTCCGTKIK